MDPAYVNIAREAHKTGKPVELWGFQSADTTGGWKKQIVLHIDAKGLQGVDIDHLSAAKGELEVLFPHKARFFVRKVEQDKYGKTHIHVEESVDALTGEALKLAAY
jgi:hypothetical protein